MKKLLTIIILLYATVSSGQTQEFRPPCYYIAKLDTIPHNFIISDKVRKYNYYNKDNSLAWGGVKEYSETLVPGAGIEIYIPGNKLTLVKGYKVERTMPDCKVIFVEYLDANKKTWEAPKPSFEATVMF
jgi:hypothetical protein